MPTLNEHQFARKILNRLDRHRYNVRDNVRDYRTRAQAAQETVEAIQSRVAGDAAQFTILFQRIQAIDDNPTLRARFVAGLPAGITRADVVADFVAVRNAVTTLAASVAAATTHAQIITACDTLLAAIPGNDEIDPGAP